VGLRRAADAGIAKATINFILLARLRTQLHFDAGVAARF
jgi:hypothetical protein